MRTTIKEETKAPENVSAVAEKLRRTAASTGTPKQAVHGPAPRSFRRERVHGIRVRPENDPATVARTNDIRHVDVIGDEFAAIARRTADTEERPTIVRGADPSTTRRRRRPSGIPTSTPTSITTRPQWTIPRRASPHARPDGTTKTCSFSSFLQE